jgi:bacterioferritin-associated ferredoxin
MIEALLGAAAVALAFMAVAFVKIRAGCGSDCGACDRPCELREEAHRKAHRTGDYDGTP